jgi:hypothetical protein
MEAGMEPIVVSTQDQYDEARKRYQTALYSRYFDIDRGEGLEIVEEVDYLIYNYLCNGVSKEDTENSLSRFYFNESQAGEITGYFITHRSGDLYEIERGLNFLNLRPEEEMNKHIPPIHIRDGVEKIKVYYPVEVYGESEVEASGYARVTAHDAARITAHDRAIVESFDNAQVMAFEQSHITARNNSAVILSHRSTATAYNHVSITAGDHAKTAVFNEANAHVSDHTKAFVYNHTHVTGRNMAIITAYHDAAVNAFDDTLITAKDISYTFARGSTIVYAENNTVVVAGGAVKVDATHHALVFTGDDAVCEHTDKTQVINSTQNKPSFLKSNILRILDHPYINREPVTAVNLLLASADPNDKEAFSRKLKEMGCIDPPSTNRVLNALAGELDRRLHKNQERDGSWER